MVKLLPTLAVNATAPHGLMFDYWKMPCVGEAKAIRS